jgi:peptide/nickel transport system permease protein
MTKLLAWRLTGLVVTLAFASLAIFVLLDILPGDPAELLLGTNARPDTLQALRHDMLLDLPPWLRFVHWAGGLLTGDLGMSQTYHVPVATLISERLPVSLPLAVLSLLLAAGLGLPGGLVAALRHDKWLDRAILIKTQIVLAIPNFWLAMVLIFIFAISLHWLPAGGFAGWSQGISTVKSLILPSLALAAPQAAILARVSRAALLETFHESYMVAARARGLSMRSAMIRHALPNALIPVLSIMGLQFSFLLAGTIIIENVFYLPGLGRLMFQAINQRDLVVVSGATMILVASVIVVMFCVDLAAMLIDPRLRRRS